jgi:hypothetical protein
MVDPFFPKTCPIKDSGTTNNENIEQKRRKNHIPAIVIVLVAERVSAPIGKERSFIATPLDRELVLGLPAVILLYVVVLF